jgi:hypothetical protein
MYRMLEVYKQASIQVSSGLKREPHTVGKQHNPSGELRSKTTSDESDQTVLDDYKKRQMQMPGKQIRMKLPVMRMLDTGEPADVHLNSRHMCTSYLVTWDTTQYLMHGR